MPHRRRAAQRALLGGGPRGAGVQACVEWRSIDELPYTDLVCLAAPSTRAHPLPSAAGARFVPPRSPDDDAASNAPEVQPGRIAVVAVPGGERPRTLLVIEQGDWSVACALTTGQLHRLTNAVGGRGTRTGVRPLSVDGELVHLTGSPELLIVEDGERTVHIPAGPRRALAKALRAYEAQPPLG